MFRMLPGVGIGDGRSAAHATPVKVISGLFAVIAVSSLGLLANQPAPRDIRTGETEMAQRSAAIVAATYRTEVDIDRRDRMLLVSYDERGMIDADRFAWAMCDTIRSVPEVAGSSRVLRDWQVVALPEGGMPGSCRIGKE